MATPSARRAVRYRNGAHKARHGPSPHFSPGAVMIAEDFGPVRVLGTESIAGTTVEGPRARTGPKDPRGRGQRRLGTIIGRGQLLETQKPFDADKRPRARGADTRGVSRRPSLLCPRVAEIRPSSATYLTALLLGAGAVVVYYLRYYSAFAKSDPDRLQSERYRLERRRQYLMAKDLPEPAPPEALDVPGGTRPLTTTIEVGDDPETDATSATEADR